MGCETYSGLGLGEPDQSTTSFFNSVPNIPSRESDEAIASTWEQAQAHGHSLGGGPTRECPVTDSEALVEPPWKSQIQPSAQGFAPSRMF